MGRGVESEPLHRSAGSGLDVKHRRRLGEPNAKIAGGDPFEGVAPPLDRAVRRRGHERAVVGHRLGPSQRVHREPHGGGRD
jgi:hypothetical protein